MYWIRFGLVSVLWLALACGDDDTSTSDVGVDTSAPDTSASDSGVDTSTPDTSAPDTGMDTSTPDTSMPDTSMPDTAPPIPDDDPLMGIGAVETIQTGFLFLEGPHWRAEDGVLLFTDIPANIIYRLTGDTVDTFRTMSQGANGLGTDISGELLACEHGGRRVSRSESGTFTTVVDRFEGQRLNSPNDIAVRDDGTIYFTDPPYGISEGMREVPFNGVYRVPPDDGALSAEWRGGVATRPNGVILSPSEDTLYVAFTVTGEIKAWDVDASGALSGERTFAMAASGADGMAMDLRGNLYVTSSAGVEVFAPDGTRWGAISFPMQPANCAFGDDDALTLYVTARSGLYKVRMRIPGDI